MISLDDVRNARIQIKPYVKRTDLEKNTTLSQQLRANIYLKLELFQRAGSFKPRGAFNQILQLTPEERKNGVVGVSGGNFTQGMALAGRELNTRAILPSLTDVIISIGGGGLIAGITVAIKSLKPDVNIGGVETEGSDTMGQALRAGKVVHITPKSLSKTLGAPYVAQDALILMQKHPRQHVLVSDKEAFEAGVFLLERAKLNTELAASCTLAAAWRIKECFKENDHIVLLICGGNNSLDNWVQYSRLFG